jgi:hypothetical protein
MRIIVKGITIIAFITSFSAISETKVKYKKSKNIDFESLLIEGENKKPDMSIVTGNIGEKDLGLLKLRENFVDHMSNDAGEIIR